MVASGFTTTIVTLLSVGSPLEDDSITEEGSALTLELQMTPERVDRLRLSRTDLPSVEEVGAAAP